MISGYKFYIEDKKIERYFTGKGYNVISFRKFLIDRFGYKNSAEIQKDTEIRESLLKAKLVYSDEELYDLKVKVLDLIEYIKSGDRWRWWTHTRQVLFSGDVYGLSWHPDNISKLAGKYELRERFKTELKDITKSLIDDGESDNERYI